MDRVQDENWRRSFINGHKVQLLKKWRELEKKREQKRYRKRSSTLSLLAKEGRDVLVALYRMFNEGLAEGYFMHDFDMVERYEEENAAGNKKRRDPFKDAEEELQGADYYGLGRDGFQAPHQMWQCCILQ